MPMPQDPIKAEETRKRMSLAWVGRKARGNVHNPSEETRRKLSVAKKGKPFSEEHKKNLSLAWEKRKERGGMSEETKEKIRKTNTGRIWPDGFGAKISASKKGKPNGLEGKKFTEEHRKNISKALAGKSNPLLLGEGNGFFNKKHTEEARKKMSTSKKGKPLSPERRARMREYMPRGEKNSRWKGGITEAVKQIRSSFEYRQWRSDIFYRDDFTCQDCFVRGEKLHAHHLKKFSSIMEENNIRTMQDALECAELWSLENGITLCKKCHKLRHRKKE